MTDHLIDSETVERIAQRAESYLHLARRLVVDTFGPEAGHDQTQVIASVASMMANLENAEMIAASNERLVSMLRRSD